MSSSPLSLANFDPFAVHPFTAFASPAPSPTATRSDASLTTPPSSQPTTPTGSPPTTLHAPTPQRSNNGRKAIFEPFCHDRAKSPELADILSKSHTAQTWGLPATQPKPVPRR